MNSRPAAPEFIAAQLEAGAPAPGHAFFMYFSATMSGAEAARRAQEVRAARQQKSNPAEKRQAKAFLDQHAERKAWGFDDEGKADARQAVEKAAVTCPLPRYLRARQRALAAARGDVFTWSARLTSPFATGLGIEHPTENGFAFLWPYGVAYLPGSGAKGVLRRAAEMLASGEGAGLCDEPAPGQPRWSLPAVWALFGFDFTAKYLDGAADLCTPADFPLLAHWLARGVAERATEPASFLDKLRSEAGRRAAHARGALEFWDVFPDGSIAADIMNPHAHRYLQGDRETDTPAECDSPGPIFFLTVREGAELDFHVRCRTRHLHPDLARDWRPLLAQAFALAADWLGFGAKTAVGYGALAPPAPSPAASADTRQRAAAAGQRSVLAAATAPRPADPALGGKARELLEKVERVHPSQIGGAVDGWYAAWMKLAPADQPAVRDAVARRLREWKRGNKRAFEERARRIRWLAEWLAESENLPS